MQGGAGLPHSSRLEDRSANYLTIIIMTMTTGTLGTSSAWCQQGQRQKMPKIDTLDALDDEMTSILNTL